MIHNLDIDYKNIDDYNLLENKIKLGNNNYKILINEGITESLAIYLYNYYLVEYLFFTNDRNKYEKKTYYNYYMCLDIGLNIYNCKKTLDYYDIKFYEDLYKKNNFNQTTNVFSYIYIKLFLLLDQNILNKLLKRN